MAFARSLLEGAVRLGHDPSAALAAADISTVNLSATDGRISAAQMERLSGLLMRQIDDEALGWFHRRLPWGSYGMLARASISSPTLKTALQRWCRHHWLLTDDVLLTLRPLSNASSQCAEITLQEVNVGPWLTGELREFCHVSLLRNLFGFGSWLVDSRWPLIDLELGFPLPEHVKAYPALFSCPAKFSCNSTILRFDSAFLSLPVRRDEVALNEMLHRPLSLMVKGHRPDRLLAERIRALFHQNPSALKSADELAHKLHTSPRTLHRNLRSAGTSVQEIKNQVRMELANELLLRTNMSLKQIASKVGYQDAKAFSRAYKHLTGRVPLSPETTRKS